MTGEIPREANLSPRGVVNSGFRAKSSQLRAQFVKTRALASDSRVLDGSTGNTTPVCLSNEPKSDSTRLSLPELEFGHHPLNPFPAACEWVNTGLFGASPTPPHAFSDQIS